MKKYKKILATSLTFVGTCLSLAACNMGSNSDNNNTPDNKGNRQKFVDAVENEQHAILSDMVSKLTTQKNYFYSSPKSDIQYWTPKGTIDSNPGHWNIVNPTYWDTDTKDNLVYGIAYLHLGYINWDRDEGSSSYRYEYTMPIFLAFDQSNNMLYSSSNSGFNNDSGLLNEKFGSAFDNDFGSTGFLLKYLQDASLSDASKFYTHYDGNAWGSLDLWNAGYTDILQILPNDDGKLQFGLYQNKLSFLNASIRIASYRYGDTNSTPGTLPGKRHFMNFLVNLSLDEKTNKLNVKINGVI